MEGGEVHWRVENSEDDLVEYHSETIKKAKEQIRSPISPETTSLRLQSIPEIFPENVDKSNGNASHYSSSTDDINNNFIPSLHINMNQQQQQQQQPTEVSLEHLSTPRGSTEGTRLLQVASEEDFLAYDSEIDDDGGLFFSQEPSRVSLKYEECRPFLSETQARSYFRDTLLGLEYMHFQGIVHRDIKPANLLLTVDNHVKISDFGVSHLYERSDAGYDEREFSKTAGTPAFFAPELCDGDDEVESDNSFPSMQATDETASLTKKLVSNPTKSSLVTLSIHHENRRDSLESPKFELSNTDATHSFHKKMSMPSRKTSADFTSCIFSSESSSSIVRRRRRIGQAIDVWALGVTLYCFVFGRLPFIADSEFELYEKICGQALVFPWKVDEALQALLEGLLEKDPGLRLTLAEAKRNPWVLRDLDLPEEWLRDTDPARASAIIIDKEDVQLAVRPRTTESTWRRIGNNVLALFVPKKKNKGKNGL